MLLDKLVSYWHTRRHAKIEALMRRLRELKILEQRYEDRNADDEWGDEVRIMKKLAKHGEKAKSATSILTEIADASLWGGWGGWDGWNGQRVPGKSLLGALLTTQGIAHGYALRQESLVWALGALLSIRADDVSLAPLLRDVITEGALKSRMGHSRVWEQVPYRSAIRGYALLVLAHVIKNPELDSNSRFELCRLVPPVLRDPDRPARFAAVTALEASRQTLTGKQLKRLDLDGHVLVTLIEMGIEGDFPGDLLDKLIGEWKEVSGA